MHSVELVTCANLKGSNALLIGLEQVIQRGASTLLVLSVFLALLLFLLLSSTQRRQKSSLWHSRRGLGAFRWWTNSWSRRRWGGGRAGERKGFLGSGSIRWWRRRREWRCATGSLIRFLSYDIHVHVCGWGYRRTWIVRTPITYECIAHINQRKQGIT